MKKLSLIQMQSTKGGKFIGTVTQCTECVGGIMACAENAYFFWVRVGCNIYLTDC